jgi:hypothetical protein
VEVEKITFHDPGIEQLALPNSIGGR